MTRESCKREKAVVVVVVDVVVDVAVTPIHQTRTLICQKYATTVLQKIRLRERERKGVIVVTVISLIVIVTVKL